MTFTGDLRPSDRVYRVRPQPEVIEILDNFDPDNGGSSRHSRIEADPSGIGTDKGDTDDAVSEGSRRTLRLRKNSGEPIDQGRRDQVLQDRRGPPYS